MNILLQFYILFYIFLGFRFFSYSHIYLNLLYFYNSSTDGMPLADSYYCLTNHS